MTDKAGTPALEFLFGSLRQTEHPKLEEVPTRSEGLKPMASPIKVEGGGGFGCEPREFPHLAHFCLRLAILNRKCASYGGAGGKPPVDSVLADPPAESGQSKVYN